jgi:hypothetical protein
MTMLIDCIEKEASAPISTQTLTFTPTSIPTPTYTPSPTSVSVPTSTPTPTPKCLNCHSGIHKNPRLDREVASHSRDCSLCHYCCIKDFAKFKELQDEFIKEKKLSEDNAGRKASEVLYP